MSTSMRTSGKSDGIHAKHPKNKGAEYDKRLKSKFAAVHFRVVENANRHLFLTPFNFSVFRVCRGQFPE